MLETARTRSCPIRWTFIVCCAGLVFACGRSAEAGSVRDAASAGDDAWVPEDAGRELQPWAAGEGGTDASPKPATPDPRVVHARPLPDRAGAPPQSAAVEEDAGAEDGADAGGEELEPASCRSDACACRMLCEKVETARCAFDPERAVCETDCLAIAKCRPDWFVWVKCMADQEQHAYVCDPILESYYVDACEIERRSYVTCVGG